MSIKNTKQQSLFDKKKINNWEKEWIDMPEFIQKNKQPIQKIVVSFETKEDVQKFAKITGYKITDKTKSIWFPYREKNKPRNFAYIDDE